MLSSISTNNLILVEGYGLPTEDRRTDFKLSRYRNQNVYVLKRESEFFMKAHFSAASKLSNNLVFDIFLEF